MSELRKRQLEHEKMVRRYMAALDVGDFETIGAILLEAEQDAVLEQMILEVNDVYADELEAAAHAQDAAVVQALVRTHFTPALPESAVEPPLLTVGHVIARIHADAALRGKVEREALAATRPHQTVETPLPKDLSQHGVSQLLEQLGVRVSQRFQKLFRDTALFMRMGRNQGMARLAATRRQQQARSLRESQIHYLKMSAFDTTEQPPEKPSEKSVDQSADTPEDENTK